MKCEKVRQLIWLSKDREFSEGDRDVLVEHLEHCPECRELFDMSGPFLDKLKNMPMKEVPENLELIIPHPEKQDVRSAGRRNILWRIIEAGMAGVAATVIISAIVWFLKPPDMIYIAPGAEEGMDYPQSYSSGVLVEGKEGYITLKLNSRQTLEDVKLEVMLPNGVSLPDGRKKVVWEGSLYTGENRLIFKVQGIKCGNWMLQGVLIKDDREKSFQKEIEIL